MIPPVISRDCASPGEAEIFRRLKNDPAADDWLVLHSLDISHHSTRVSGEIDFVVIIPSKGVLCLEVKACSSLRRSGGEWYYGSETRPDSRGPFKQAAEGMHSLRRKLAELNPGLSHIVFWSGVIFPYVDFGIDSSEWHSWQVIDARAFRSYPISTILAEMMDRARDFLKSRPGTKWFSPESKEPDPRQCQVIAETLRPDFEYFESSSSRAGRLKEELKHYTDEQFLALDAMEHNPRVLFKGPAGTGKTLLAIEAARRSRNAGRKVLFVCYNRLLGKWLEEQMKTLHPQVQAGTIHRHMLDVSRLTLKGTSAPDERFWEEILPSAAIDTLLKDASGDNLFDEIVADEAQDILLDSYVDFLDLQLKGGLAAGRWRFFGDFEKQAIYGRNGLAADLLLEKRAGSLPIYSLRTNCRNTPRIAALAYLLGGLDPNYQKVLRPDDKVEPELLYFSTPEKQENLLAAVLSQLAKEGYQAGETVVLSLKSQASCAANMQLAAWKNRLKPFERAGAKEIRYGSIHSFKGLEAPAVIVTDVDQVNGLSANALFYIAVTRALQRLVILLQDSVKTQIIDVLAAGAK